MQQFNVSGMSCGHCVSAVTEAVRAADPDASVTVDLHGGRVTVDGAAPRDTVAAAIVAAGYDVAP